MIRTHNAKTAAVVAFALLPVAILLAQVQAELNQLNPDSVLAFKRYLSAPLDLDPIWRARALPRWIINSGVLGKQAAAANVLLQTFTAWVALLLTSAISRRFLDSGWVLAASLAVALFSCWGWLSLGYNATYPYDYPALLFSALGIYGIITNRLWIVVLTIAIGTFNKETTFWLIPAWVAVQWPARGALPMTWRRPTLQVAALAIIFGLAYQSTRITSPQDISLRRKALTVSAFTDAHRTQSRLQANLKELMFRGRGGFAQNIYWPLLIHLPALLFFRKLPRTLQRLYFGAPFLIAPNFIVGNIWEVRIFNELLPLGAVASATIAARHNQ